MENILFDFISKYISLSEEEKQMLISLDIFRTMKKGTILLEEGQRSNEGYFVLKGCLRSFYIIDGEEKTSDFYTEMEGHTPNCVLSKQASKYSISCTEDSIISVSNPGMEEEVFEKFPKFEKLCRILTEQLLSENQSSFDEFKTSSPEKRYLNLLKNRPTLCQRVPQHQLVSYLGIAPQSLSRMRSRLVEKKT
jgi:CRP-like cAMP-binding protein